jgi:hypothetical protein
MYRLHKVYCATPWELEAERRAFCEIVGEFNERHSIKTGLLYIPIGLGNARDKRPFQYAVSENIRESRHYIQLFDTTPEEGWGPPERNFQRDYRLALECSADPALPMREVAVLAKKTAVLPPEIAPATEIREFADISDFRNQLLDLFEAWLASASLAARSHGLP